MSDLESETAEEIKTRREVQILAAIGLVTITAIAIGGVAWSVVVNNTDAAVLGTIASLGTGSLATLAGSRALRSTDNGRSRK